MDTDGMGLGMGNGKWPGDHHHQEFSDKKVPLVKMSQDDPLNPSSKNYQVDSKNNNQGESNMFKEKTSLTRISVKLR